jgi:hypothetical protein
LIYVTAAFWFHSLDEEDEIKVLYIAGSGRSGTTVIARLLGEFPGFVNVGEAARYFLDDNERAKSVPCGCGRQVAECAFWRDTVRAVPQELEASGAKLLRLREFPRLFVRSAHSVMPREYAAIAQIICDMYHRTLCKTAGSVIVDSSKNPSRGLLVSLIPGIELHLLHVVRDPNGVVTSWRTAKGFLATHPPWKAIAWWWIYNLLSEGLRLRAKTYRLVRYEDFARQPGAVLQQIAADVTGAKPPLPFLDGREASLHEQHMLGGNPDKLRSTKVRIETAIDSSRELRRLLTNLLTFPLQWRYKYRPFRKASLGEDTPP